jgi:hypothetical protein
MIKWPQKTITFLVIIGVVQHVATVSPSGWGGNFVVEESGWHTLSPLLHTEPLKNVWFKTFTRELNGCPFWVHIVHSILPSLSRVGIKLPACVLLWGCPVWNAETFEHGAWVSVESNITDSFKHSGRVEVLSINVHHDVRLLVEFVAIDVLNA